MILKKYFSILFLFVTFYFFLVFSLPEKILFFLKPLYPLLGYLFALFILLNARKQNKKLHNFYIFLSLSIIFCLIGDFLLFYQTNFSSVPFNSVFYSTYYYLLCNFFLVFSVGILIKKNMTKWDSLKLFLEVLIIGSIIFFIVSKLFLINLNLNLFSFSQQGLHYFSDMFYVVSDSLMILGFLVLYSFNKNYFQEKIKVIQFLAFFMWFFADLFFIYSDQQSLQFSNYFMLLAWPISFILIAIGSISTYSIIASTNTTHRTNNFYLISTVIIFISYLFHHNLLIFMILPLILLRYLLYQQLLVHEANEELQKKYIETNAELYNLANIDPLTKIFNRRKIMEELGKLDKENSSFLKSALLFIDLDRFKTINDWYGHEIGDIVLIETARRLSLNISKDDILGRQGGDEFVIILNNIFDEEEVFKKSLNILSDFKEPFVYNDKIITIGLSIGVSFYPNDSDNYLNLMKFADISLYKAKCEGKNKVILYNNSMEKEENRKLEIETRIFQSIKKNEMFLVYQPQFDTTTKKIIGLEALIRWKNKELGFISPGEFIPIAEENGYILEIGEFVLEEACKTIKHLNSQYNLDLKIGINVSPKQFHTSELNFQIKNLIDKYYLKPNWIDLEITEYLFMKNEEKVLEKIREMKQIGIQISIDDFGTGYSSLSYLKKFPADTLKIDIEFIRNIDTDIQNYKIVKAIIAMSRELGIKTIAEGVENEEHYNVLKTLKCNQIQGYYFSKPLPLEEIILNFFE